MPAQMQQISVVDLAGLDQLIAALKREAYSVIGPTVQSGAVVLDEIEGVDDLPRGWGEHQAPGRFQLDKRNDEALFGFNNSQDSWKKFLYPSDQILWRAEMTPQGLRRLDNPPKAPKFAFLGVHACDLNAIAKQDQVFGGREHRDPTYSSRREHAFIVAVNCTSAGETCFCSSMGTGPQATQGFDLALTELLDDSRHEFLVDVGSERGAALLNVVPTRPADEQDQSRAEQLIKQTAEGMGHSLDTHELRELLQRNYDHPHWREVARRCLACTNCTMVCPTCFCADVEDISDLTGQVTERHRRWDSCFTPFFSFTHGGSIRDSVASRYRQWITHKLSTWHDQFGSCGCVGCGRCITWCPVGIDITEEAAIIRARDGEGNAPPPPPRKES